MRLGWLEITPPPPPPPPGILPVLLVAVRPCAGRDVRHGRGTVCRGSGVGGRAGGGPSPRLAGDLMGVIEGVRGESTYSLMALGPHLTCRDKNNNIKYISYDTYDQMSFIQNQF